MWGTRKITISPRIGKRGKLPRPKPEKWYLTGELDRDDCLWFDCLITKFNCTYVKVYDYDNSVILDLKRNDKK
jgi:hypothetical protein